MDDLQPFDRRGRELGLAARPLLVLSGCRSWENHINKNQTKNHLHRFLYKTAAPNDRMETPLRRAVEERIEALFPPDLREAARRMLVERCGAELPFMLSTDPIGLDRIRCAVLKLSEGDLDRLKREIEGGRSQAGEIR